MGAAARVGVRRVFGYPGDGIAGLMGALDRTERAIDFAQARHEEMSGLIAYATAKFTGEVGICIATSGPAVIYLLNGLYDARLDNMPAWRPLSIPSLDFCESIKMSKTLAPVGATGVNTPDILMLSHQPTLVL